MTRSTKYLKGVVKPFEPFYVAVGATDLTLERLREMGTRAIETAPHVRNREVVKGDMGRVLEGVKQVPARALNQTLDVLARNQARYENLARRGRGVVQRTRTEAHLPSGAGLRHQVGETAAMGRKVATRAAEDTRKVATTSMKTVRDETDHLVEDTRRAATATIKNMRAEAGQLREAVTRRQLPKTPHVPASLRRRTEAKPPAAAEQPKPTPKTATKPTAKAAPRPARKSAPRKRSAAATKPSTASTATTSAPKSAPSGDS